MGTRYTSEEVRGTSAGGTGALAITFGFVGALVAFGIMHLAETPWLDPMAFYVGVGVAAVLGTVAAWGVQRLRRSRWTNARWLLVPIAGALVGMSVQAMLLRIPMTYTGETVGLTKAEPFTWVLAGAPLGALPASILAVLLHTSVRLTGRMPALDSRERMLTPMAGVCLLLAVASMRIASHVELPAIVLVAVLATATLVEVAVRDHVRARWLARAFAGEGELAVVPLTELPWKGELPAVVGGALHRAAVVRVHSEAGYRASVRTPIAGTSDDEAAALRPLKTRRALTALFLGAAGALGLLVGFVH